MSAHYLLDLLLFINIYTTIFNVVFRLSKNERHSKNIYCLIHAILSTLMSGTYILTKSDDDYYAMTIVSTGYFIYDTFMLLTQEEAFNLSDKGLLGHHALAILIINSNKNDMVANNLLMFELGNIPNVLYSVAKSTPFKNLEFYKTFRFVSFGLIRVVIIPIVNYYNGDMFSELSYIIQAIGYSLYLMSIYWFRKLYIGYTCPVKVKSI